MHTLCLLDIKVKEPDFQAMMRGQTKYMPPRFMTVNTCIAQLLEVEERIGEGHCAPEVMGVGLARLGQPTQCIVAGTLQELLDVDFGGPLHSFVVCGELHDLERDYLAPYMVTAETPRLPPPAPDEDGAAEEGDEVLPGDRDIF